MLSVFEYLLYVIIIMLIYGIKMVRKIPIFLTYIALQEQHQASIKYRNKINS
jgi:hypothetical protein